MQHFIFPEAIAALFIPAIIIIQANAGLPNLALALKAYHYSANTSFNRGAFGFNLCSNTVKDF